MTGEIGSALSLQHNLILLDSSSRCGELFEGILWHVRLESLFFGH